MNDPNKSQTEPPVTTPAEVMDLIDGASGEVAEVSKEMQPLREIILDKDTSLEERLEAYEDIIDSQVGDTALMRARNIEREVGIRQIFLKFEGSNPSGTQNRLRARQSFSITAINKLNKFNCPLSFLIFVCLVCFVVNLTITSF